MVTNVVITLSRVMTLKEHGKLLANNVLSLNLSADLHVFRLHVCGHFSEGIYTSIKSGAFFVWGAEGFYLE